MRTRFLIWICVTVVLAGLSACGGGNGDYSEEEVIRAFAKQGVELDVVIRRGPEENPLDVILAPPTNDHDELNVNLFTSERLMHM